MRIILKVQAITPVPSIGIQQNRRLTTEIIQEYTVLLPLRLLFQHHQQAIAGETPCLDRHQAHHGDKERK